MTDNRRIFWNIVATYGRNLYALLIGLFTARWTLNALGAIDYGLFGVIGGISVFIGFFNNTLASANGRFYAISIGQANASEDKQSALEECRRWFNTAFSIHTSLPFLFVVIGYPIGVWAIRHFLTVPVDRIESCIWVFRFSCLAAFVGMLNVPFSAMYTAKQRIAELTIYSYITTTVNAIALYYMVSHPADWLVRYALLACLISVLPQVLICIRSFYVFPECRIRIKYMWDWGRFKKVGSFALYNAMGALCAMLRIQGVAVLINKSFGAMVNAAMTIGNSINAHTASLSSSLMGAFYPAITVAYGEGKLERMRRLSFKACKFGAVLFLAFAMPLIAELDFILKMWLKNPPNYTGYLCMCVLIMHLMDVMTQGHMVAVNASGRIKEYQLNMTKISILTLPLAVLTVWLGGGVYGLGLLLIGVRASISLRRVYYARLLAGLEWQVWMRSVVLPITSLVVAVGLVALLPRLMLADGFLRVCCVTFIIESLSFLLTWYVVMDCEEREYIKIRVKRWLHL